MTTNCAFWRTAQRIGLFAWSTFRWRWMALIHFCAETRAGQRLRYSTRPTLYLCLFLYNSMSVFLMHVLLRMRNSSAFFSQSLSHAWTPCTFCKHLSPLISCLRVQGAGSWLFANRICFQPCGTPCIAGINLWAQTGPGESALLTP